MAGAQNSQDIADNSFDSGPATANNQTNGLQKTQIVDGSGNVIGSTSNALDVNIKSSTVRGAKASQITTITSSTAETIIGTAIAATFLDMYGIIIANTSATKCDISVRDDTGGTVRFIFSVPAGDTRGFMVPESGACTQTAVNKNWTAQCSASVASIVITPFFVKNV